VPCPDDEFKARGGAQGAKELDIDEDRDKDLFEQVEQLELMALADPHGRATSRPVRPVARPRDVRRGLALRDIQEQITKFKAELDPRERVHDRRGVLAALRGRG
jgi:hypothetical protein